MRQDEALAIWTPTKVAYYLRRRLLECSGKRDRPEAHQAQRQTAQCHPRPINRPARGSTGESIWSRRNNLCRRPPRPDLLAQCPPDPPPPASPDGAAVGRPVCGSGFHSSGPDRATHRGRAFTRLWGPNLKGGFPQSSGKVRSLSAQGCEHAFAHPQCLFRKARCWPVLMPRRAFSLAPCPCKNHGMTGSRPIPLPCDERQPTAPNCAPNRPYDQRRPVAQMTSFQCPRRAKVAKAGLRAFFDLNVWR